MGGIVEAVAVVVEAGGGGDGFGGEFVSEEVCGAAGGDYGISEGVVLEVGDGAAGGVDVFGDVAVAVVAREEVIGYGVIGY